MSLSLGIDIGGTKIAAGVVDEDGKIIAQNRRSTPARNPDAVVDAIVELAEEFTDWSYDRVGIGVAGLVDVYRSRVIFAPNLGWADEKLKTAVEERTNKLTVVENDANAAAWGEFKFGAGRGTTDMVMVTVGTGIGGGIVLGGELQRGAHGMGAELGHLRLVRNGQFCGCGRDGCWEQYASGNALVRTTRQLAVKRRREANILLSFGDGTPEGIRGRDITAAAKKGDPVAIDAFKEIGKWLGRGMAEVASLLDPGCFIVGGGVIDAGDLLLEPAREVFGAEVVAKEHHDVTPVIAAELGNAAGIAGAADLARH